MLFLLRALGSNHAPREPHQRWPYSTCRKPPCLLSRANRGRRVHRSRGSHNPFLSTTGHRGAAFFVLRAQASRREPRDCLWLMIKDDGEIQMQTHKPEREMQAAENISFNRENSENEKLWPNIGLKNWPKQRQLFFLQNPSLIWLFIDLGFDHFTKKSTMIIQLHRKATSRQITFRPLNLTKLYFRSNWL